MFGEINLRGFDIWFYSRASRNDFLRFSSLPVVENMFHAYDFMPCALYNTPILCHYEEWLSVLEDVNFDCLRLDVFPKSSNIFQINSYQEFSRCDSILSVILYDVLHLELYIKDRTWLDSVYKSAVSQAPQWIRSITDKNDQRIGFYY